MKKIRAAIYTRISTDKNEQQSSLKAQKQYYSDYCKEKGYEMVKMYTDEGISATSNNRKEFLEMIHDGGIDFFYGKNNKKIIHFEPSDREPKYDLIICKDVSRFARNVSSENIASYLDEKGVSIHFENSSLKTGQGNWKFELSLYLTFAENESRDRSKKMKWSLKNKADQDQFSFSVLPYGFDYIKETNEYVINPEEAEVIRQIYDMYVNQDMGVRLIAEYLNNNDIPNKKGKGKWVDTTLSRMISSERYIGNVVVQKFTKHDVTGSGKRIIKDEEQWKRIEGALEPIIDKELWDKAQEIKNSRIQRLSDNSKKGKRLSEDNFRGKIKCGKCGSHFTRLASNKIRGGEKTREYFYQCYNRRKHKSCDMRGLSKAVIEREILNIASKSLPEELNVNLESEQMATQMSIDMLEEKIKSIDAERKTVEEKINTIDKNIDMLFNQFLGGELSDSIKNATQNKIGKLEDEKVLLVEQLKDLSVINLEKSIDKIISTYKTIEELSQKKFFTYEEIVELLHEIRVFPEREFTFMFNIPTLVSNVLVDTETGEKSIEHFSDTGMNWLNLFEVKY